MEGELGMNRKKGGKAPGRVEGGMEREGTLG